ncbi:hypothetical protein WMY93_010068 [Mugilogobius chulae]|uniref:Uncharacterized protein n=1 Tax=Mugilogobius chulae TaxID=88201 RepID=A0AAW0PFD3_9GOBI
MSADCALKQTKIAEFEKKLRRSKEENQKKQKPLEAVLNPSVVLFRENVQIQPSSPGAGLNPALNQDLETPQTQIKEEPEEPRVKQEEEQRFIQVKTEESLLQQRQTEIKEETQEEDVSTEQRFVQVKTEESLLEQRQTEIKEETQGEDFSAEQREETHGEDFKIETHFHLKTESDSSETDNDDDWGPFSCSGAAGDHNYPVQTRKSQQISSQNETEPETRAVEKNGDVSGTAEGAEKNRFKCSVYEGSKVPRVFQSAGNNQKKKKKKKRESRFSSRDRECSDQPSSSGSGLNPGLNQDLETPQTQIKEEPEEPRVKQEEEQRFVQVKTEESLLEQRQTEIKEETQGEDFSTEQREETHGEDFKIETHFHLKTESDSPETDNDDDWGPFSCSGAAGDHNYSVQTRKSQQNSFEKNGDVSGTAEEAEKNRFKCSVYCALKQTKIAEFEKKLRRSKEENQRKQELEAVLKLNPRVVLFRESVLIQPSSPGAGLNPGLNQELETQIKEEPEEPRVKQEEEQR